MHLIDEQWLDVSLNNLVEEIKSLRADGVDVSALFSAAADILGEEGPWTIDRFVDKWVTLEQYNKLQHILKKHAGHAEHLRRAGQNASKRELAYGETEGLKRLAANWLLRWFSSPAVGISLINTGTKNYNTNKTFDIISAQHGEVYLKLNYLTGSNGEQRTAEDEINSVLDRVRGVLESIERMWQIDNILARSIKRALRMPPSKPHGDVTYLTVDIRPEIRLKHEWPEARMTIDNYGKLLIQGERYGRLVDLYPHPDFGGHLFRYTPKKLTQKATQAILIERDVLTPCTRTGEQFPIMRKGEVYRYQEHIDTIIKINYHTNTWRRMWDYVLGARNKLRYESQANLHKQIRETNVLLEGARQREEATKELLAKILNPPTEKLFREFALAIDEPSHPQAFKATEFEAAVLFADLEGFTMQSRGVDSVALFDVLNTYHDIARSVCFRHDALIYKTIGDGFMAVFPRDWEGDNRNLTTGDLIERAIKASQEMMTKVAHKPVILPGADNPVRIRLGINAGAVTIGTMGTAPDAIGDVVNFAARAESASSRDKVSLTQEAIDILLHADEKKASAAMSKKTGRDVVYNKHYLFENKGIVQIKKDKVHVWELLANTTPFMQTDDIVEQFLLSGQTK